MYRYERLGGWRASVGVRGEGHATQGEGAGLSELPTCPLTRPPARPPTHSLTHSLTHLPYSSRDEPWMPALAAGPPSRAFSTSTPLMPSCSTAGGQGQGGRGTHG